MKRTAIVISVFVCVCFLIGSAFAGGAPPKTSINLVMKNDSQTTIITTSGYCNVSFKDGGGGSYPFTFSGEIAPGGSKSHKFEYTKGNTIDICELRAYPKGGNRKYGLYGSTRNAKYTTFKVTDSHIRIYEMGQNAHIPPQ